MADDKVEIEPGELEDLGQFLAAIKTIVLGLEARVGYIEAFLTEAFSPAEDVEEGDEADPNAQYIDIQPATETSEAVNEVSPEDVIRGDEPSDPEGI